MTPYVKVFTPQYPNGWQDKPNTSTPVIANALNGYDSAIEHIEEYLYNLPSEGMTVEDISESLFTPEQGVTMGDCIAYKYGNLISVERLNFSQVQMVTSGSFELASFNEGYVPKQQSFMRILWNLTSNNMTNVFCIGFISGQTGKIAINKASSATTTDIFALGFSYLIG